MFIDRVNDVTITTCQEERGFSFRTFIFNHATGEVVMHTIHSDAVWTEREAAAMHERYVSQFS